MRDPRFKSDEGGQLTATLKREFGRGDLVLYARYLDDKNQFITPIPVIQRGRDDFSAYPGFDPLTGTYNSRALRHVRLDGFPGGVKNADLADGRGAQMFFVGANFDYEFDSGWSISDKFLANGGEADTNALFSGTNPATLFDELYTVPTELGGFLLPAGSATATFVGGGAVAADRSVIHQGWWSIEKDLENINNDFRLHKEVFDGNTLTVGLYLAYYTMDEYTDYNACFPFTNVVTGNGCAPIEGQQLQRQPKLRYVLTPSYRLPLAFGDIEAYVTYTDVGDHTQDQAGLQELGSYYTWDFGVTAHVGDNWQVAVRGTNVTDELGLTESNSRIFGVAAGSGGVLLARPIEGREINFQAKYQW